MQRLLPFSLQGQSLCLSADRCIFWEEEKTMIVSDLHFGKTGHFRKYGIAVPQSVFREDIQRLVSIIQYFNPRQLIVTGDMFHSTANKELELFSRWRSDLSKLPILLVKGNHDILHRDWYFQTGIELIDESHSVGVFSFRHDPGILYGEPTEGSPPSVAEALSPENSYLFAGHLHPGITLKGVGKQALRFPCFYFSASCCILPAFSRFTGSINISPVEGDAVFAVVNQSLIRIGG